MDSAHMRKKKKKIPPANGTATTFCKMAAIADMARMQIMAMRFRLPQVRERTTLEQLAIAPYVIAENNVVSWIVSSHTSTV